MLCKGHDFSLADKANQIKALAPVALCPVQLHRHKYFNKFKGTSPRKSPSNPTQVVLDSLRSRLVYGTRTCAMTIITGELVVPTLKIINGRNPAKWRLETWP